MSGRERLREKHGFVLLIVVITLAIACLLLYQLAGVSFERIRWAVDGEKNLRNRWALVSLRQTLLTSGPAVLHSAEQRKNLLKGNAGTKAEYVHELLGEVRLADIDFQVLIEDESAKLNVPALIASRPEVEVKQYLDRLTPAGRVRPKRILKTAGPWCWDDVFEIESGTEGLEQVTSRVTLWGNARLNIYRADQETLHVAWRAAFGHFPPSELPKALEEYPPLPWEKLVGGLGLRQEDQIIVNRWFSNESSCFSLSIRPRENNRDENTRIGGKRFVMDRGDLHFGLDD